MAQRGTDEWRANITAGRAGQPGHPKSTECRAKMRAARLRNNPMKGARHTDETRAKMRAATNKSHAPGDQAVNWRGGRITNSQGYIWLYMPDHPDAIGNYVAEHRLLMERSIGRRLLTSEVVHHVNEVRTDNRLDNLQLMTLSEHHRLHRLRESALRQAARDTQRQ